MATEVQCKLIEELNIAELKDENRKAALWGRLPEPGVNDYKRNDMIQFWTKVFIRFAEMNSYTLSIQSLSNFVKNKEGIAPLCLAAILNHLISSGVLVAESEYTSILESDNNPLYSSLLSYMKGLTSWVSKKVKTTETDPNHLDNNTPYVVDTAVKGKTQEILNVWKANYDGDLKLHLATMKEFKSETIHLIKSINYGLVIACLIKDKEVKLVGHPSTGDHIGMKFKRTGAKNNASIIVTESDRSILLVKHTIEVLETQVQTLESNIKQSKVKAVTLVKENKRKEAIAELVRKKTFDDILQKRNDALFNLQHLLESIYQMKTDVDIYKALSEGSQVLKKMQTDVTPERIDDTMVELEEALANQQEIDNALSQGARLEPFEEDELSQELDSLFPIPAVDQTTPADLEEPLKFEDVKHAVTENDAKELDELKPLEQHFPTIPCTEISSRTTQETATETNSKEREDAEKIPVLV